MERDPVLRQQTIDTYDQSADELAEYFRGIGPRVKYINKALELADSPDRPRILELGCGDGRDAKDIITKAGWYEGIDISASLVQLAQNHVPRANFKVADMVNYDFPDNLDVIFSFASLLHLDQDEVKQVLANGRQALRPNGIFYISSKWQPIYRESIKDDQFGRRLFYYYNPKLIKMLAGTGFKTAVSWREKIGRTDWFELALRKL